MGQVKKTGNKEIDLVQCVWGLLCSLSSTDKDSNNISLFNIVEQFNLPQEAFNKQKQEKKTLVSPIQYEVILFFRRTLGVDIFDEEILSDLKIKTIDPNENVIQETISSFKFPKGMKKLRFRIVMGGLFFTTAGNYIHQVEIRSQIGNDFKKLLEIPFEILEKKAR
jgi:hypothetical protein